VQGRSHGGSEGLNPTEAGGGKGVSLLLALLPAEVGAGTELLLRQQARRTLRPGQQGVPLFMSIHPGRSYPFSLWIIEKN
jgi:hypothetical protein